MSIDFKKLRPALLPFSALYGGVVTMRNKAYDRELIPSMRAPLPVVCVGNITAGGSGKTPFIGHLGRRLFERGRRPAILTRGYGGRIRGPHLVQDNDTPESVGDEAILHSANKDLPVIVARDRVLGAYAIVVEQLGDIALMDDGYQHRRLSRDLNVLLLDVSSQSAINRWLHGRHLPAGDLRESLAQGLKRADCVVFVQKSGQNGKGLGHLTPRLQVPDHIPRFNFFLSPSHWTDLANGKEYPLADLSGTSAAAVTAVAVPENFYEMLHALRLQLTSARSFPDHHLFTEKEWRSCLPQDGSAVCITAKDAVKLKRFVEREQQVFVLHLAPRFGNGHEKQFLDLVEKASMISEDRYGMSEL